MQIEWNESAAQILARQASAHGRSIDDDAAAVLTRFANASAAFSKADESFKIGSDEDALLWILSRNPGIEANRPEDTDWQHLKNEGRRF